MEQIIQFLLLYLLIINIYGFVIMGLDKRKAAKGQWRISEKRLLGTAAAFGSLGVFLGMRVFRHKTKHPLFQWSVPIFLLIHSLTLVFISYWRLKGL